MESLTEAYYYLWMCKDLLGRARVPLPPPLDNLPLVPSVVNMTHPATEQLAGKLKLDLESCRYRLFFLKKCNLLLSWWPSLLFVATAAEQSAKYGRY